MASDGGLDGQVARDVAALETMGLEGLRAVWRDRFGQPPKLRSVELVRLALAWRIQAAAFGGLDADTRRRLRRGSLGAQAADRLEPGVILVREWRGVRHDVVVETGGFAYRGKTWRSLSEVAREITGVRWNGPKFFGLRAQDA